MFREIFFVHHFIPPRVGVEAGAAKIEEPGAGAAKKRADPQHCSLPHPLQCVILLLCSVSDPDPH